MENKKIMGTFVISSAKDIHTGKVTWQNAMGQKITAKKGIALAKTMKKTVHPEASGFIITVYSKRIVLKAQKPASKAAIKRYIKTGKF